MLMCRTHLATVSEYEKNPCASGWLTNLVARTTAVRTEATKDTEPTTMYKWAKDMATRLGKSKTGGMKFEYQGFCHEKKKLKAREMKKTFAEERSIAGTHIKMKAFKI